MAQSFEELKSLGNKEFVENNFELAENLYTEALAQLELTINNDLSTLTEEEKLKYHSNNAILLTNRAASRINTAKYELGLDDAVKAIEHDPKWVKAYYRKANALEKLGQHREAYHTWLAAAQQCETSAWLSKQVQEAKTRWLCHIYTVPVESEDDFIARYSILEDPREKLSMLAHFWNELIPDERLLLLFFFISLIGGQGEISEANQSISVDMMMPMPLHNYEDLPRSRIALWCDYYRNRSSEDKLVLMNRIWTSLDSLEQDAVINDLKLFVSKEMQTKLAGENEGLPGDNDDDDILDHIKDIDINTIDEL